MLLTVLLACNDYSLTPKDQLEATGVDEEPEESAPYDDEDPVEEDEEEPPVEEEEEEEDEEEPVEEEEPPADADPVGCADGTREGFQDQGAYPRIAACAGAWSEPGVTIDDNEPTCGHTAGNDGSNREGDGCSSIDVCAEDWHVCEGWEVADLAGSCDDAVPDGSPDKSLFFAVYQPSENNSVCDDDADRGNDVFGCGNLGTDLSEGQDCGVLNKVIASMNPGTCGYNEAEPSHGPWECYGDDDSHYHEGELVTKIGCWGDSCSYDGYAVGNSDKGGVLCCL